VCRVCGGGRHGGMRGDQESHLLPVCEYERTGGCEPPITENKEPIPSGEGHSLRH
jgi:hypothetical protein